jgi:hypothetical protein
MFCKNYLSDEYENTTVLLHILYMADELDGRGVRINV